MSQAGVIAATSTSAPPNAEEMRNQLTDQLMADRQFAETALPEQLLVQLRCIDEIDSDSTEKQNYWRTWQIVLGIASALAFILTFMTMGIGLVVFIPCLIGFIVAWRKHRRYRQLNVENRRHRIPHALIRYLKTDIPPDQPVSLEIDFRNYQQGDFQTGKEGGGFFNSVTQTRYEVPWLKLSGQFYDGTKFRLKITQNAKRKEKRKSKRTKITETFRDKYNLAIAVKPHRYPGLEKLPELIKQTKPPQGLTVAFCNVSGNRATIQCISAPKRVLSVNTTTSDPYGFVGADPALQLFLACYHCLGQCRIS